MTSEKIIIYMRRREVHYIEIKSAIKIIEST